eukprot:maker-scaffold139_size317827-snap-gene-2.25 protein:Tk05025 transcript:maker-scaffold139_size317827-snap-gene-2.25-mRNA-1 annotation:"tonb-dependent receptor plug"
MGCGASQVEHIDDSLGANDVLVVAQEKGDLLSTSMSLFVSKYANSSESGGRTVAMEVNDRKIGLKMTLNSRGIAAFARDEDKFRFRSREWKAVSIKPGINDGLYKVPSSGFEIKFSVFFIDMTKPLILVDLDASRPVDWEREYVAPFTGLEQDLDHIVKLCHKLSEDGQKEIVYLTDQIIVWDNSVRDDLFLKYQNRNGFSLPKGPVILRQEGLPKQFGAKPRVANVYKTKFVKELLDLNATIEAVYGTNEGDRIVYEGADLEADILFFGPSAMRDKCLELFGDDPELTPETKDEDERHEPEGEEHPIEEEAGGVAEDIDENEPNIDEEHLAETELISAELDAVDNPIDNA